MGCRLWPHESPLSFLPPGFTTCLQILLFGDEGVGWECNVELLDRARKALAVSFFARGETEARGMMSKGQLVA
jgi:hypothetical protein